MPSARYAKLAIDVGGNLMLETARCTLSLGCLCADRRVLLQSADIHFTQWSQNLAEGASNSTKLRKNETLAG